MVRTTRRRLSMTAFEPVNPKVRFPELEERILGRW
jgi:hypothetical protein